VAGYLAFVIGCLRILCSTKNHHRSLKHSALTTVTTLNSLDYIPLFRAPAGFFAGEGGAAYMAHSSNFLVTVHAY